MNKMIKMMLVLTAAFLLFTGCSKQTSWTLTINDEHVYSKVSVTQGLGGFGWEERVPSTGTFTIKNDGEYAIVVKDEADKEYTITIISEGGKAEVKADESLSVDLKKK